MTMIAYVGRNFASDTVQLMSDEDKPSRELKKNLDKMFRNK